jgi:beta-glucosidase-like glycosyl hydrolase
MKRLEEVELAPFKALMNKGVGGVMVAHLYVPTLENEKGIPASVSKNNYRASKRKAWLQRFDYNGCTEYGSCCQ